MGEAKQRTAAAAKEQADPAAVAPPVLGAEMVQKMIDDALAKIAIPTADGFKEIVVIVVREQLPTLVESEILKLMAEAKKDGDALAANVQSTLAEFIKQVALNVETAIPGLVDKALDERDQRLAEAAEAEQRATSDAAVAEQRKAAAAARTAAKAVETAEEAARKKRSAAIDRAHREYTEFFASPIPSALEFADADSIMLRFGDGSTFLPEFELVDIPPSALADDGGRPALTLDVIPSRELVPFHATEAILMVEGGSEPIALWRAEIMPPAPVGGGNETVFPSGSLAFRRVSPLPAAATA